MSALRALPPASRIEDMTLMEALVSEAWYVGAPGSVRTIEKRLERLAQLGLTEQQLGRLHAPVGLPRRQDAD